MSKNKGRIEVKNQSSVNDLLQKEEEYKRLNEELEAQTSKLVREAEAIMVEQENFLLNASRNSTPSLNESFDGVFNPGKEVEVDNVISVHASDNKLNFNSFLNKDNGQLQVTDGQNATKTKQRRPKTQELYMNKTNIAHHRKTKSSLEKNKSISNSLQETISQRVGVATTISAIEDKMQNISSDDDVAQDETESAITSEMGSVAQIRFLKAKLRVIQEEYEKITKEYKSEIEKKHDLQNNLKASEEEKERLKRINQTQTVQIEKNKTILDNEKQKLQTTKNHLTNAKKELESTKQELKKVNVVHNATEVRLNRALEDIEKYRSQLLKEKNAGKENLLQDKREMDNLRSENKRLERLQTEMSAVFKKQQKLINVLKRQILHIEAAKMLSFTEDQFLKALDWGNQ